jgi:hypothetical protein
MDDYAKLLTAMGALTGAIAWPVTVLVVVSFFRAELRSALGKLPQTLERLRKAILPGGVALELDQIADAAVEGGPDKGGKITPQQIEVATRIKAQTQDVGSEELLRELDRLCLEYDSLRRTLPSSPERSRAMTRVIVKMRSLAPSLVGFLDRYKGSGSPGSRLAAIAMMQMVPQVADLAWLKDRFSNEKQPFLLYHAALALQNIANVSDTPEKKRRLGEVAEQALTAVKNFPGVPDRGTVEALEMVLSSIAA